MTTSETTDPEKLQHPAHQDVDADAPDVTTAPVESATIEAALVVSASVNLPPAPPASPSAVLSIRQIGQPRTAVARAAEAEFDDEFDDEFADDSDDDTDDDSADYRGQSPTADAAFSPRLSLVTPKSEADQQLISAQMDRLSLEQALLDVEVANARVLDLTARLVEANQRIGVLSADVDQLRNEAANVKVAAEVEVQAVHEEMAAHQAHLDAQRSSSAFRWASKVWNLRNALRS